MTHSTYNTCPFYLSTDIKLTPSRTCWRLLPFSGVCREETSLTHKRPPPAEPAPLWFSGLAVGPCDFLLRMVQRCLQQWQASYTTEKHVFIRDSETRRTITSSKKVWPFRHPTRRCDLFSFLIQKCPEQWQASYTTEKHVFIQDSETCRTITDILQASVTIQTSYKKVWPFTNILQESVTHFHSWFRNVWNSDKHPTTHGYASFCVCVFSHRLTTVNIPWWTTVCLYKEKHPLTCTSHSPSQCVSMLL